MRQTNFSKFLSTTQIHILYSWFFTLLFAVTCSGLFGLAFLGGAEMAHAQTQMKYAQHSFFQTPQNKKRTALGTTFFKMTPLRAPLLQSYSTQETSSYGVLVQASDTGGAYIVLAALQIIPFTILLVSMIYVLATNHPNGQIGLGIACTVIFGAATLYSLVNLFVIQGLNSLFALSIGVTSVLFGGLTFLSFLMYRRGSRVKGKANRELRKKSTYRIAPWLTPVRGGVQGGLALSGQF